MKQGWEIKKLGEVCEIVGGSTPKTNEPSYWDGEHYWVAPAELDGAKYISSTKRTITDAGVKNAHLQLLPKGSVLLSSRAPIGKVAITTVPMYCNQGFKNLVCSDKLHNEFAYWFLYHNTDYLNSLGTGATFKEISKRVVEQIPIPVPPISEQERIVEELDCLSGVIEKKREQLKELDALAESIFYTMFGDPITNEKGWEEKKWGELFDTILGKMLDKKKQVETDLLLPYLGNTNVQWGYFVLDELKTMTFSNKERFKLKLEIGDILICEGGEAGRCAVWKGSSEEILFQKAIHRARVRANDIINPIYTSFLLKEIRFNGGLKNFISKATIEHLTGEKLDLVPIICPPIALQQEFVDKIDAIEKQKELIKQSITETEELFNSRMDYYFN